jgi:hypothetical protein
MMKKKANVDPSDLLVRAQGGWAWTDAHLKMNRLPRPEANVVFHPSSHVVKYTIKNRYTLPGDPSPVPDIGYTVPHYAGDYRLVYAYGRVAHTEFSVIPMKVETLADIVLQRRSKPLKDMFGTYYTSPLYCAVLALGGDGAHWLFVSAEMSTGNTSELEVQNGYVRDISVRRVSPIIRIARSEAAIKSISGTADAQDNLTITWTDVHGKISTIKLDQDKKDFWALPPSP